MTMPIALLAPVAAVAHGHAAQPPRPSGCLRYGPDTVRLTGTLERRTYYGAPNFGEDPAHDEKEVGFYLGLAAPVCAAGGADAALGEPQHGVRRVQLVLDSAGYARLRPHLGQTVVLRGTLFPAHTGHHHAPILLDVLRPASVEARR
ncbi:MAG: DUF4431 domain-containing protein [Gemmatirosa sp.]|nr:DUF4431 domain-containing protein [Gemmatirosa sp.]